MRVLRNRLTEQAFLLFRRLEMPIFHFEIVDGYIVPDPTGIELPTAQAAKKLAVEIAKRISIDVEHASFKEVVVKTDDGKEIYKASIKPD
jgi:hypothetical protein